MGRVPIDIETQSRKKLFSLFRYFSVFFFFFFFFFKDLILPIKPKKIWRDREFEGLLEYWLTSHRHPNPEPK